MLRNLLPADAQKHLAAVGEWARHDISRQLEVEQIAELRALHTACTYARDVLVETVEMGGTWY